MRRCNWRGPAPEIAPGVTTPPLICKMSVVSYVLPLIWYEMFPVRSIFTFTASGDNKSAVDGKPNLSLFPNKKNALPLIAKDVTHAPRVSMRVWFGSGCRKTAGVGSNFWSSRKASNGREAMLSLMSWTQR